MEILSAIDNYANDIMSSGIVQIIYFAVIVVCLVILVLQSYKSEGFWSYDSGASLRKDSQFSQPTQGVFKVEPTCKCPPVEY